jgi:hypothetical protein
LLQRLGTLVTRLLFLLRFGPELSLPFSLHAGLRSSPRAARRSRKAIHPGARQQVTLDAGLCRLDIINR